MHTRLRLMREGILAGYRLLAILVWITLATAHVTANAGSTDHVLLVDNTSATGEVDVERRLRDGLAAFIRSLPEDDRLAIVLYEDLASPIAPLRDIGESGRATLIDSLNAFTFTSSLANPAAGLERAIYELTSQPRPAENSRILLVHAGRLRTGNQEQDAAFHTWLEKVLIDRAAQHRIVVDVISLGTAADQQLAHLLTERTGGQHRQLAATEHLGTALLDLDTTTHQAPSTTASNAFADTTTEHSDSILTEINRQSTAIPPNAGREPTDELIAADINRLTQSAPPHAGAGRATSADKSTIAGIGQILSDHQLRLVGITVAVLLVLTAVVLHVVRRRPSRDTHQQIPDPPVGNKEVQLLDLNRASGKDVYVLDGRLTRICRNRAQDTFNVVCITIPDEVISREHAFIECRQGKYWVTDPGSNNGTFVNDKRIHGDHPLQNGDRLRFAKFDFQFLDGTRANDSLPVDPPTEQVAALDPMKTQVAPRPLALVRDSEARTIANKVANPPTANEDTNGPIRTVIRPKS